MTRRHKKVVVKDICNYRQTYMHAFFKSVKFEDLDVKQDSLNTIQENMQPTKDNIKNTYESDDSHKSEDFATYLNANLHSTPSVSYLARIQTDFDGTIVLDSSSDDDSNTTCKSSNITSSSQNNSSDSNKSTSCTSNEMIGKKVSKKSVPLDTDTESEIDLGKSVKEIMQIMKPVQLSSDNIKLMPRLLENGTSGFKESLKNNTKLRKHDNISVIIQNQVDATNEDATFYNKLKETDDLIDTIRNSDGTINRDTLDTVLGNCIELSTANSDPIIKTLEEETHKGKTSPLKRPSSISIMSPMKNKKIIIEESITNKPSTSKYLLFESMQETTPTKHSLLSLSPKKSKSGYETLKTLDVSHEKLSESISSSDTTIDFDVTSINLADYGIDTNKINKSMDDSEKPTQSEYPLIKLREFKEISDIEINFKSPETSQEIEFAPTDPSVDFEFLNCTDLQDYDTSSFDNFTIKELRKIMKHVYTSPNLYAVLYSEEKKMLHDFFSMDNKFQHVCFTLYRRQAKWYRLHKFIEDLNLDMSTNDALIMSDLMCKKMFVKTDYSGERPAVLLNVLLRNEVKDIFDSFKIKIKKNALTKDKLIKAIVTYCNRQSTLTSSKSSSELLMDRIRDKMKDSIKLEHAFYFILFRIHLLYSFTNPDLLKSYDLYKYIIDIDLKNIILPQYSVDYCPVFINKKEFYSFSKATEFFNEYNLAKEKKDKKIMLELIYMVYDEFKKIIVLKLNNSNKPKFLMKFTAGSVYAKTLSMGCDDFTADEYHKVIIWLDLLLQQDQYSVKKRGKWYDQLSKIYDKYIHDIDKAASVILEALKSEHVSFIDKHDLSLRGSALRKRKNITMTASIEALEEAIILEPPDKVPFPTESIEARAKAGNQRGHKREYIIQEDHGVASYINVETVALRHYETQGYRGVHCEGELLKSLFVLLFWDIIYKENVAGAFISAIQTCPLDLFSRDFYLNRKKLLDARLDDVRENWSNEELSVYLIDIYERNCDVTTFVQFGVFERFDLLQAIKCIRRTVLADILERLIMDFRACRAGLPDLFVWNVETEKCKFVEVKGQGDTLSMKQKLWLQYLIQVGANVEVCHVHTIGSKATKKEKSVT